MRMTLILSIFTLLVFSSCKKHFTCNCDEKIDGIKTNNNGKTIGWMASKNEGNSIRCSTYESTHDVDGTTVSYTCTLTED